MGYALVSFGSQELFPFLGGSGLAQWRAHAVEVETMQLPGLRLQGHQHTVKNGDLAELLAEE